MKRGNRVDKLEIENEPESPDLKPNEKMPRFARKLEIHGNEAKAQTPQPTRRGTGEDVKKSTGALIPPKPITPPASSVPPKVTHQQSPLSQAELKAEHERLTIKASTRVLDEGDQALLDHFERRKKSEHMENIRVAKERLEAARSRAFWTAVGVGSVAIAAALTLNAIGEFHISKWILTFVFFIVGWVFMVFRNRNRL